METFDDVAAAEAFLADAEQHKPRLGGVAFRRERWRIVEHEHQTRGE